MSKFIFINEKQQIFENEEAKDKLSVESDSEFISDQGIVQVTKKRWQKAQDYETHYAMKVNKGIDIDIGENVFHAFDNFKAIQGKRFDRGIELGCGMFTHLRYISTVCNIQNITLEDPLINKYLTHRYCNYNKNNLYLVDNFFYRLCGKNKLTDWFAKKIFRRLFPHLFFKKVPIEEIIDKPIEEMVVRQPYDLVILINVLEHCKDAGEVFDKITECCKKGSILIFQDKIYDKETVKKQFQGNFYDAGHPLRVDKDVVFGYLKNKFTPLFSKQNRVLEIESDPASGDYFFIGQFIG